MNDLSIIIINWNSVDYLERCLNSIEKYKQKIDVKIIVADNASYDGCAEMVNQKFPNVHFFQLTENLGFAGANNHAYQYAHSPFILFLNPDTELVDDSLDKMLTFIKDLEETGAVGAKLLNSDMSLQTSCVQPFPTILNQILDTEFFVRLRLKKQGILNATTKHHAPIQVDVVSGACLLIKSPIFLKVSQFSSEYFMYGEDVDLCYKIKRTGYKVHYLSQACVVHHGGKSADKKNDTNFSTIKMLESRMIFFRKYKSSFYGRCYQLSIIIISLVRILVILIVTPFCRNKSRIKNSLRKWISVLHWSLGFKTVTST